MARQPPSGPGPPYCRDFTITVRKAPRTGDQSGAETCSSQHTLLTGTDFHAAAVFEPAIHASEGQQTQVLDRAAAGVGKYGNNNNNNKSNIMT